RACGPLRDETQIPPSAQSGEDGCARCQFQPRVRESRRFEFVREQRGGNGRWQVAMLPEDRTLLGQVRPGKVRRQSLGPFGAGAKDQAIFENTNLTKLRM